MYVYIYNPAAMAVLSLRCEARIAICTQRGPIRLIQEHIVRGPLSECSRLLSDLHRASWTFVVSEPTIAKPQTPGRAPFFGRSTATPLRIAALLSALLHCSCLHQDPCQKSPNPWKLESHLAASVVVDELAPVLLYMHLKP